MESIFASYIYNLYRFSLSNSGLARDYVSIMIDFLTEKAKNITAEKVKLSETTKLQERTTQLL